MAPRPLLVALLLLAAHPLFAAAPTAPARLAPDEKILPSATDPAIKTFDIPHSVYFRAPAAEDRGLLIFIPGTNPAKGEPQMGDGAPAFCRWAANLGYRVIFVRYPNDIPAAAAGRMSSDPDAFAKFRWTLLEGGTDPAITVPRAESFENRAIKLLLTLRQRHSNQGWGGFVKDGKLDWPQITVAGLSQGAGHAALIATRYPVKRVVCFGGPKDYSFKFNAPAAWYAHTVTPPSRYFAFNHQQDRQGCNYQQQIENLRQLGILQVAGQSQVDKDTPPYHHAHVLFTNYPGTPVPSAIAHGSVLRGDVGRAVHAGPPRFSPVWTYMLTAPTS